MTRFAALHGSNDLYGASRVLLTDVEALTSLGHDVTVVLPTAGQLTRPLEAVGAQVVVDPDLAVMRRTGGAVASALPRRLPRVAAGADVLLINTLALTPYVVAGRAARKEVVVSVHELLPGAFGRALTRAAAVGAHWLLSNSRATSDRVIACHPRAAGKIVTIYPAAPRRDATEPPSGSPLQLTLAGRVNGKKGHKEAAMAVERLNADGLACHLVLYGAPFPGQEEHLAELLDIVGRTPHVEYRGEVDDVLDRMREAHAVLVPSTYPEPFGIVALEAWAAGRRVIAFDVGGLSEATRLVDGVLCSPLDPHGLDRAIAWLAGSTALREPPRADAPVSELCSLAARAEGWARRYPPV